MGSDREATSVSHKDKGTYPPEDTSGTPVPASHDEEKDEPSTVCDLTGATFPHTGRDKDGKTHPGSESKVSEGPRDEHEPPSLGYHHHSKEG